VPNVRVGRKMNDDVGTGGCGQRYVGIEQIPPDETKSRVRGRTFQESFDARGEIVDADDGVAVAEQAIDHGAADESGTARYQKMHGVLVIG